MNVRRCENNPIIETSESIGDIVNYPSVIEVPSWINNPLGNYYLYFAHKNGKYIRLAYADEITGPWEIYGPGTLRLDQTKFVGHIGSPNVHVDDEDKLIRLYYHGETRIRDLISYPSTAYEYRKDYYDYKPRSIPHRVLIESGRFLVNTFESRRARKHIRKQDKNKNTPSNETSVISTLVENAPYKRFVRNSSILPPAVQETRQAVSSDGLSFTALDPILGPSWFAMFSYADRYFALGRDGHLYESQSPSEPFRRHQQLFSQHRHFGVYRNGDQLEVYYSRPDEMLECIYRTAVSLTSTVSEWEKGTEQRVICPEQEYEGTDIDAEESKNNNPWERRQELRDPYIFVGDGTKYLFYVVAGESGIAVAELTE